jgi:long-subunit fatty acid transport protein
MRLFPLILVFSFLFSTKMMAQIGYRLVSGGQSAALGNAALATHSADAVFQNPASLLFITRPTATLATEMRFGVKELRPIGVGFIQPTKSGVFGFSLQHFGFSAFQQQKLGVALARRFSDKLDVGIQLDYLHLQAPDYGNAHLLTFEIGCNTLITKDLILAAYVYNPLAIRLNEEHISSVFRLGIAYSVNDYVVVATEIEKNLVDGANFRFGINYKIAKTVAVRCGFSSLPASFSFGIGYQLSKNIVIDAALAHQALLGSTPSLSLTYDFGKEKSGEE